jgi:hypothetical protein
MSAELSPALPPHHTQGKGSAGSRRPLSIFTTSWFAFDRLHRSGERRLVPVRISLGTPDLEWAAGAPYVSELAPYGLLRTPPLSPDDFDALYVARLEKHGAEKIAARLAEIHTEYHLPLALLCFEPRGKRCHRRTFVAWWLEETGQEIPELAAHSRP